MVREEDRFLIRLKRVKGQLEGVIRMYQAKRSCEEIFQQINAVRAGLDQAMIQLFEEEACRSLSLGRKRRVIKLIRKIVKVK